MKRRNFAVLFLLSGFSVNEVAMGEQKAQYFVKHTIEHGKHIYKYRFVKDVESKTAGFVIGEKDKQNLLQVLPEGFVPMLESPSEFRKTTPKKWDGEVWLQEESKFFSLTWVCSDPEMAVGLEEVAGFSVALNKEDSAYESYEASGVKLIHEYTKPVSGAEFRLELLPINAHAKKAAVERKLEANVTFAIPDSIERTGGKTKLGNVEFMFRPLKQKVTTTCNYKWNQKQKKYKLSRCSDGRTGGDNALAAWFQLTFENKRWAGKDSDGASVVIVPLQE